MQLKMQDETLPWQLAKQNMKNIKTKKKSEIRTREHCRCIIIYPMSRSKVPRKN